jgi:hypothetical protein
MGRFELKLEDVITLNVLFRFVIPCISTSLWPIGTVPHVPGTVLGTEQPGV